MALYADLQAQHYLDATYGVVSNEANSGCDNYNLYTAEAMIVAGWTFWPQYKTFFEKSQVAPGLMTRYPYRENDGISQDEMIGAATLDALAAARIYEYGQAHWWYFNPDKQPFSLSHWFGRFIDFAPYVKQAAGLKLNLLDQIKWCIGTIISPLSEVGNTSDKCLKWVQFRKVEGRYWLCNLAIKFWRARMHRQYPGGMKAVFAIYFGQQHPITVWARKDFQ